MVVQIAMSLGQKYLSELPSNHVVFLKGNTLDLGPAMINKSIALGKPQIKNIDFQKADRIERPFNDYFLLWPSQFARPSRPKAGWVESSVLDI
jgi:hypothetical protein